MITICNRTIPAASRSGCNYSIGAVITAAASCTTGGGSGGGTTQDLSMLFQTGSTNSARLGVGNCNPQYRIHITGSGATATQLHCYFPTALQQSNAVVMQGTNSAYFVAHSTGVEMAMGASIAGVAFLGSLDNSPVELRTSNAKRICLVDTCVYVTVPTSISTSVSSPIMCASSCIVSPLVCSTGNVKGTIITGSTCLTSPIIKSANYVSGNLTGQGYCLDCLGNMEISNLTVRCGLHATELDINKIKYSSDLAVSAGGVKALSGLTYNSTLGKFYFTVTDADKYTAQKDDILHSQAFTGNDIHSLYLTVATGTTDGKVFICENYNCISNVTNIALNNVNYCCFCLVSPPDQFYLMASNAVGQYSQSNAFCARIGTLNLCHCVNINIGSVGVALYDCSNNLVCHLGTVPVSCMFNCTIPINSDCSYRTRYIACTSGNNTLVYKPNVCNVYPNPATPNVAGYEFIVQGNKTNSARQNIIEISANQTGAPYIRLLKGVSGCTVNPNMVKTCLDSTGLYADGAYLVNACMSGSIIANDGNIGGWTINTAQLTDGFINLDSNTHNISISDSLGIERVNINNSCLTTLANLLAGSCVNILEACATGADLRIDSCAGTTTCTIYYQEVSAGVATSLTDYTSCQASKNFPVCCGNYYNTFMSRFYSTAYALCSNTCTDMGDTYTCRCYSPAGTFRICGSTCILDNANNLLQCRTWTTGDKVPYSAFATCRTCNVELYGGFQNTTGGTGVYLKTTYSLINNVTQTECFEVWNRTPSYRIYNTSTSCPLLLCANFEVDKFCYNSTVGKAELRNNGLQLVYGNNAYYRFDNNCMCVNATTVFKDSVVNLSNSSLNAQNCVAGYAATFCNTCCAAGSYGLYVKNGCANETTCIYTLRAFNNAGTELGGLANTTAGAFALYTLSDCNAKCNICNASISALSTLQAVPVKEFNWKSEGKGSAKHIGYIAQETDIEGMRLTTPEGCNFIAPTVLIPYLHKAIVELAGCVAELKALMGK